MTTAPNPTTGCYVDGHWGQYAGARVIQVALDFGWDDAKASDLAERHLSACGPSDAPGLSDEEWDIYVDAVDDAERWLNENAAAPGYFWSWEDGEFFYYSDDDDDNNETEV